MTAEDGAKVAIDWGYLYAGDDLSRVGGGLSEPLARRAWREIRPPGRIFRRTVTYGPWEEVTNDG
uniref:hypothetical protein n=1 Tax=Pseudonocardia sp. CA-138482 TaxID=3240023 RepID=UPI003F49B19C